MERSQGRPHGSTKASQSPPKATQRCTEASQSLCLAPPERHICTEASQSPP